MTLHTARTDLTPREVVTILGYAMLAAEEAGIDPGIITVRTHAKFGTAAEIQLQPDDEVADALAALLLLPDRKDVEFSSTDGLAYAEGVWGGVNMCVLSAGITVPAEAAS